jgi:hypothetical protein
MNESHTTSFGIVFFLLLAPTKKGPTVRPIQQSRPKKRTKKKGFASPGVMGSRTSMMIGRQKTSSRHHPVFPTNRAHGIDIIYLPFCPKCWRRVARTLPWWSLWLSVDQLDNHLFYQNGIYNFGKTTN